MILGVLFLENQVTCDANNTCNVHDATYNNDFFIDLNLGTSCNFRCKYCFEQGCYTDKKMSPEVVDRFLHIANEMLAVGTKVNICFWGGEPMLYMDTVQRVIDELGDNEKVTFLLYSNGWFVRKYSDVLDKIVAKCGNRFSLQISYDFLPVELNNRVMPGKTQIEVATHVLDAVKWCDEREMMFSVKSTATIDDVEHHLFDIYKSFIDFRETLKHKDMFYLAITPDTLNKRPVDTKALDEQLKQLLVYFAKHKMRPTYFRWFDDAHRAVCSGGAKSFIIDVDGTVYPCHRCVYGWGDDHDRGNTGYTSIFDDNVLYKVEHNFIARNNLSSENEQCAKCDTLMCFRCNAANCGGDLACWDKSNYDEQCKMYKFISNYIAAYQKMSREW